MKIDGGVVALRGERQIAQAIQCDGIAGIETEDFPKVKLRTDPVQDIAFSSAIPGFSATSDNITTRAVQLGVVFKF